MSILKIWSVFSGYLVVAVRGYATEKFINLAIKSDVRLWDISISGEQATFKVGVDSFFALRHLAKKTGCRLHIVQKVGFPFFYRHLIRRKGTVCGLIFFVLSLYMLSSMVLFIGVDGAETIGDARIRELAAELGVKPGIMKANLESEQLANEMIIRNPDIAWVNFKVRGTRLVIEVVEKIKAPPDLSRPADLVAAKDGLVVDVLTVMGEARVKPGDTVTRGQLLIEGLLRPHDPLAAPDMQQTAPVPVHAQGEVWARVWYEGYGESALDEVQRHRSGNRIMILSLLVDGQEVLRVGRSNIPFRNYEIETVKRDLSKRIIQFPVEIITEYAYELNLSYNLLSYEQALEVAAERGRTLAQLQIPVGVEVTAAIVEEIKLEDEKYAGARYVIETLENIVLEESWEAMDDLDSGTISQNGSR